MKSQKFYLILFIAVALSFLVACICSLISCLLEFSYLTLINIIVFGLVSILFIIFFIHSALYYFQKSYYISKNSEFYIQNINIFENATVKKRNKLIIVNKGIKDHLSDKYKNIYFNSKLNFSFEVYELTNNLQLLCFSLRELDLRQSRLDYNDLEKNTNNLIEILGISKFNGDLGMSHLYSNDKRCLITIEKGDNSFFTHEYRYQTEYCSSMKKVLINPIPHWISNRDGLNWTFDTFEKAKCHAVKFINDLNDSYSITGSYSKVHYFILKNDCIGTLFHEFQTGNKENVRYDKTSIFLSDDIVEKSYLYSFFEKVIPDYDYCGSTLVTKEIWEKIKIECKKESQIIQDIIEEMIPWAESSIETYNCFTIIGI